jgi:hypothetical protein
MSLNIPTSTCTVAIKAIDTTTVISARSAAFLHPSIPGHETLNLPTLCFLLEHGTSGKRVLFDAGSRKDWWNLAPSVKHDLETTLGGLQVERGVEEVLEAGSVSRDEIGELMNFPLSIRESLFH